MMTQKREAEVWQRVMAASAECPPVKTRDTDNGITAQQVMELLEKELLDVCTYRTLAGRMRREPRRILLQLAQAERRHYRKLEAIYYLMTGQRPCPERPKAPCMVCTNEELRKRYQQEAAGAEAYHKLAEQAGSFSAVFHCLGHEEERHAAVILELLQQCL